MLQRSERIGEGAVKVERARRLLIVLIRERTR